MTGLLDYAKSFLGVPYVWGGNNRLTGMDCSGFVCEVLRAAGLVGSHEDLTCQQLLTKLSNYPDARLSSPAGRISQGSILFFKPEQMTEVTHVALALGSKMMIECGGAGHECKDRDAAARLGAMVRMRPISSRKDLAAVVQLDWLQLYA